MLNQTALVSSSSERTLTHSANRLCA